MMKKCALIACLGTLCSLSPTSASSDLRAILLQQNQEWAPETQIFFPSDPNWQTETTQRWNIYSAPSYLASIKPGSEADVQKAVKIATGNNIPFLATGAGHGYSTTFGGCQNGLEIDLGYFKRVEVDKEDNKLTIGGSVTFAEIVDPLYSAGKEIQIGSCPCVGVVGATLGAGVGRYQGIHGLILDALLSAIIVTAEGKIINVSATENSDLFWGLRGAGFNFAIVLYATYKIADLTNKGAVMSADFVFPASANLSFFEATSSFQDIMPAELSLFNFITWNQTLNQPVIILNAVYVGPQSEGEKVIKPFLDLNPLVQNISVVPWNRLSDVATFGIANYACHKGILESIYSLALKNIDPATFASVFELLTKFYLENPPARGSNFFYEVLSNEAVLAVPNDATAYPYRDTRAQILFQFTWTDPAFENRVNAFARSLRAKFQTTSGYDSLRVYINYAHGDETLAARYGPTKLDRLIGLKKKWDPKNVFRFNNGLPNV